jgi:hypothetical protein
MFHFDEEFYLANNPDVAQAVARDEWPSGYTHWCVNGRARGRAAAPAIDIDWYLSAYPAAALEIAEGAFSSVAEHYFCCGRYRGYLPDARARRPANPAAFHSRFGGLWTDAGNALDVVAGRRELGQIDDAQAERLRDWIGNGSVILSNAISADVLHPAEMALHKIFEGEVRPIRFSHEGARSLDPHWHSAAIRSLIFAEPVLAFLQLIFERPVLASQSWGSWRGARRAVGQDAADRAFSLPLQFAGAYFALEDISGEDGLSSLPGSHRFPDFRYGHRFKSVSEARRIQPQIDASADQGRHQQLVERQASGLELVSKPWALRRGDVVVWSADLAWAEGFGPQQSHKSVGVYFCPAEVVPDYFETEAPAERRRHSRTAFYSSGTYLETR